MNARPVGLIGRRVVWPLLLALCVAGSPFGWRVAAANMAGANPSGANPPGPGWPPAPAAPQAVTHPIPRTGDQKILVVLADFSDLPGLFTGQQWQQALFGPGGLSDYYKEVSYNQLRYTGTVVGISGGVPVTNSASVAYVRLPHPITYYADGGHGFKQYPKNHSGVVVDALTALDDAGFDFAPYANPVTHNVDNVLVIFAGSTFAYTGDQNNSLEATAYRLAWSGGIFTTSGGQTIDDYTFCPDQWANLSGQIARTGPCAHEHGHGLGDYDLYDFSYTTAGVGNYDNMGTGAYGFTDGTRPVHFSAFSKELFGWITPTVEAPGTVTVTLAAAETDRDSFVKLAPIGNPTSHEYFLLENRQPVGFDQDWSTLGGLCAGLLIWHIDQDIVTNYPFAVDTLASVTGGPPHQGVVLVEADGGYDLIHTPYNTGECSDTWTTGQTWNGSSTPNSHLWNGDSSGLALTVVGQAAGSVTVRITNGYAVRLPVVEN